MHPKSVERQKRYTPIKIQCPQCNYLLEIEEGENSEGRTCPECGADLDAPDATHDTAVIEVEARPVGYTGRAKDEYAEYESHPVLDSREGGTERSRPRIFRFEQREVGGPGCCNCGCFLMVVFLLLALQRLFSLFT